jgi:hypothetical protein
MLQASPYVIHFNRILDFGEDRCFACGRKLGRNPDLVDTRDGQTVFVGREWFKLIQAAGETGYQPKGGPRLWLLSGK